MPYIPSEQRPPIDQAVEKLADIIVARKPSNFGLLKLYNQCFEIISRRLHNSIANRTNFFSSSDPLVIACSNLEASIRGIPTFEGEFLGRLNYAITRLIQRVPQLMLSSGQWEQEIRYWVYAITVQALIGTAAQCAMSPGGIGAVFEDVKDEYKWRFNRGYEQFQLLLNGDCYNTPFKSKMIKVIDDSGCVVGFTEVHGVPGTDYFPGEFRVKGKLQLSNE